MAMSLKNCMEIAWKEREEKAKPIIATVHSLDTQRILLGTTVKDLFEESDRRGYEAEKVSKLESVELMETKSNALKQAANDKQIELAACVERKKLLLEPKSAIEA